MKAAGGDDEQHLKVLHVPEAERDKRENVNSLNSAIKHFYCRIL